MTAQELSAELTEDAQQAEGFDYDAPLPDLHIRHARSWEPAARRFRDLTEEEKASNE